MDLKFCTQGILGSLITNPSSKFNNSKWRIQYIWLKCKKLLDWDEIWYSEFFDVGDYESELNIHKLQNIECNMEDQNTKSKKLCRKEPFAA